MLGSLCLTSYASSGPIEEAQIEHIKPGVTTETDLVHAFGPPDSRVVDSQDNRLLHWTKSNTPPIQSYIPIIGPWLGGLDIEWQDLWVEVRANGSVQHYSCKIHRS